MWNHLFIINLNIKFFTFNFNWQIEKEYPRKVIAPSRAQGQEGKFLQNFFQISSNINGCKVINKPKQIGWFTSMSYSQCPYLMNSSTFITVYTKISQNSAGSKFIGIPIIYHNYPIPEFKVSVLKKIFYFTALFKVLLMRLKALTFFSFVHLVSWLSTDMNFPFPPIKLKSINSLRTSNSSSWVIPVY